LICADESAAQKTPSFSLAIYLRFFYVGLKFFFEFLELILERFDILFGAGEVTSFAGGAAHGAHGSCCPSHVGGTAQFPTEDGAEDCRADGKRRFPGSLFVLGFFTFDVLYEPLQSSLQRSQFTGDAFAQFSDFQIASLADKL